ncbi:MAG: TRAP transporter small permease [Deltaproteobacteria bacterium]|nr:TRAP transporter small permease [Deltaproteobacteria bacterium]
MFRKTIQRCTLYLSYLGMMLLIPMMLLTSGEVIGRAVWSRPIPGSMELSSYMLAVFILLGLAYTHQVKGHVRVTMLVGRLPEGVTLVLDVITTLLSLFIIALMAWQGWVVGMEERTVSDMLRIPQLPFRLLVSLGGAFLFLELLLELADTLKKFVRR